MLIVSNVFAQQKQVKETKRKEQKRKVYFVTLCLVSRLQRSNMKFEFLSDRCLYTIDLLLS
jgi:hypothetical protein